LGRLEAVMRLAAFVLSVVVIGAIGYCVYAYRVELGIVKPTTGADAKDGKAPEVSQERLKSEQSESPAPSEVWREVDRPDEGFTVEMPADVLESRVAAVMRRGAPEPVHAIEAAPYAGASFAVAWADNPPVARAAGEDAEKTMDLAQAGALARTQVTLMGESQVSIAGMAGHDFWGRNSAGGALNARLLVAGKRVYMLVASFPDSSGTHDADVSRFFNSFSLTSGGH
jgi:hypothetical protein